MKIENVDKNFIENANNEETLRYIDINNDEFNVHGLLWYKENKNYYRLRSSDRFNENINFLQKHPSGGYISFQTNSKNINIKVKVAQLSYMSHMSAIGQTGLDLYVMYDGKYIFLSNTKINEVEYNYFLIKDFTKNMRQYRLYLPLYVELKSLQVGIDNDALIQRYEDIREEKIVCYGTSISQGGCATRPGMNFSSIIGRYLNYEVINLGFSGNAHLHIEMANIISNIENMRYLIIEVEANAGAINVLKERLEPFIETILDKNKDLKIYLISHYPYSMSLFKNEIKKKLKDHYDFQKMICSKFKNISFIDGKKMLSKLDYDETVDGIHLTDLGFYFVAKEIIKKIKKD